MSEQEWFGTQLRMGWFGNNSHEPTDEFDLGHPLIYSAWSNTYFSRYQHIKEYIETKIGPLQIDDGNLQSKMSNIVMENNKESYEVWLSYSKDFLNVTIDGNNTLVQIQNPNLPKYKYMEKWRKDTIIKGLKRSLGYLGFEWNWEHRTYLKINSSMPLDELVIAIGMDKKTGKNSGLEAYCKQVAYRQEMKGIPNTFSVSDNVGIDDKCTECGEEIPLLRRKALPDVKFCVNCSSPGNSEDKIDISVSKLSEGPYSKVEQLEKLIEMRNKGEIDAEEFKSLKKELLT